MNIFLLLIITIFLYAAQDMIAHRMGWDASRAARNWYILSTILITFIVRILS